MTSETVTPFMGYASALTWAPQLPANAGSSNNVDASEANAERKRSPYSTKTLKQMFERELR